MTHDLPTTTINGAQYVLIATLSKRNVCAGCVFDKDKIKEGGCIESTKGATLECYDRLIYIPNTPEDIANHIAQRLEST